MATTLESRLWFLLCQCAAALLLLCRWVMEWDREEDMEDMGADMGGIMEEEWEDQWGGRWDDRWEGVWADDDADIIDISGCPYGNASFPIDNLDTAILAQQTD